MLHSLLSRGDHLGLLDGLSYDEQDLSSVSFKSESARKIFNQFFYDNYEELSRTFQTNKQRLIYLAEAIYVKKRPELTELERFMERQPDTKDIESFSRSLEDGRAQINWMRKHAKRLLNFFEKAPNRT